VTRLYVCSNSAPARPAGPGEPLRTGAAGGLVPHLVALLEQRGGEWVFPQPPAGAGSWPGPAGDITLSPVAIADDLRSAHYATVSVETLLWLFHYLHDTVSAPAFDAAAHAAWQAYRTVNALVADRLSAAASGPDAVVLVADYHFLLAPGMVTAGPGAHLVYAHQVPWCEPDYFGILPPAVRQEILASLLSCDTVVMHSRRWLGAFARCCEAYLPGVTVGDSTIGYRGRTVRLRAVPFPLDTPTVLRTGQADATSRWREDIARIAAGRRLLVRVDRLDLWKNHLRGLMAFEALLDRHPRLADDLCFVSVAVAVRHRSARHTAYRDAVEARTARLGPRAELVVPAVDGEARNAALGALSGADAVLINPTWDGFNLVAKEAALLGENAAVLLSRNAGAYEYLAPGVTPVDPFDVTGTADALEQVLIGGAGADRDGVAGVRDGVRLDSATDWLAAAIGEELPDAH
jgi:trehalose 6-phosphate synthase